MAVPFDTLGPGQKGRLVYQILGKTGPIPNPTNIRYLPPDGQPQHNSPTLTDLGTALAATDLLLSGASAVLKLHNAVKLRQIESHLSKALVDLHIIKERIQAIDKKLNALLQKIDMVQRMSAEEAMRGDLKYFLNQKHVEEDTIHLEGLAEDVLDVISRFEEMANLQIILGASRGLRLSVETRDLLEKIFRLLHALRQSSYALVNQRTGGNPSQTLTMNPVEDYWPRHVATYEMVVLAIQGMYWGHKSAVRDYIGDHMTRIFSEADPVAMRLRSMFGALDDNLEQDIYEAFQVWWLWKSGAGLLYRVRREAEAVKEGYEVVFDLDTRLLEGLGQDAGDFFVTAPNDEEAMSTMVGERISHVDR